MKRVVLPIVFVVVTACSCAAVFAIHTIEQPGSPVGEPTVTPVFSPNDDRRLDTARVYFDVRGSKPRVVTVTVIDKDGKVVATPANALRLRGEHWVDWNGERGDRIAPEGRYHFRIEIAGERTFDVRQGFTLDITPPHADTVLIDTTRVPGRRRVRVLVRGHEGSTRRWLELNGRRLPTIGWARPKALVERGSFEEFSLSGRLPDDVPESAARLVRLVLEDAAGNRVLIPGTLASEDDL